MTNYQNERAMCKVAAVRKICLPEKKVLTVESMSCSRVIDMDRQTSI